MSSQLKQMVLVAAHFAPSNLAAVHRSRLWAQYLPEFGWQPTIVTTHWDYYEEMLDWDLHSLVDPDLKVVRTHALRTRPLRLVGDIGVRALAWHYQALDKLARQGEMDFLHITIPSNFSAVLGRLIQRRHGTPFGLDYIDPWVHEWPGTEIPFSKAWASLQLARVLEPWSLRGASLITGVAPGYYADVLERHPDVAQKVVTAAMPYGGSERDFEALRKHSRPTTIFDADDGNFHMLYAGAMLPKAHAVLERLFEAITQLTVTQPELMSRFRLHFVGTGTSPNDQSGYNVRPHILKHGLEQWVDERPARIGYVDVLNHLSQASATLIVGSTEQHYTPSKTYQAVQAGNPVFALLHSESTAADFLQRGNAGTVAMLDDGALPDVDRLAVQFEGFLRDQSYSPDQVRWEVFEEFSARSSARALAEAADQAYLTSRK